jgi:hypothetical protein
MEIMPADTPAMARVARGTSAATATAPAVAPRHTLLIAATAHLPDQPRPTAITSTKPLAQATVTVSVAARVVERVARRANLLIHSYVAHSFALATVAIYPSI